MRFITNDVPGVSTTKFTAKEPVFVKDYLNVESKEEKFTAKELLFVKDYLIVESKDVGHIDTR
jgi:hypothetical protein